MQRRRRTSNNVQHQLRGPAEPLFRTASTEPLHVASQDYPELSDILVDRPPLERSIPTNQSSMRSFRTTLGSKTAGKRVEVYHRTSHANVDSIMRDGIKANVTFGATEPGLFVTTGSPYKGDSTSPVVTAWVDSDELEQNPKYQLSNEYTVKSGFIPASQIIKVSWADFTGRPKNWDMEYRAKYPGGREVRSGEVTDDGPAAYWNMHKSDYPHDKRYASVTGAILSEDMVDPGNVDDSEPKEDLTMSNGNEGIEAQGMISEAKWADVQEKAVDIFHLGAVRMLASDKTHIAAHVLGDHGTYLSEIQFVPGSKSPAMWNCTCPWSAYSWGRSGRWKKYEGRMCSHALALYYQFQSDPKPIEDSDWDTDKITEYIAPPPKEWRVASAPDETADDEEWANYLDPSGKFDDAMMMEGSLNEPAIASRFDWTDAMAFTAAEVSSADEKQAIHLFTTIQVNNQHALLNAEHDGFRYAYHELMGDENLYPNVNWADPAFTRGEELAHDFLNGLKDHAVSTNKKLYRAIGLNDDGFRTMMELLSDGSVDLPPASWSIDRTATQEFGFHDAREDAFAHRILFIATPGTKSWAIGQMSKRKDQREHIVGGRFSVLSIAPLDIDGLTTTVTVSQEGSWPDDFKAEPDMIEHMIFEQGEQNVAKTAEYTGGGTMVAVNVPIEIAEALALEGGEEPEELHVTLAYMKSGVDFDPERLVAAVERTAAYYSAIDAEIAGYGVFQNGDQDVLFALPSSDLLWFLRQVLIEELETEGIEYSTDNAWQPHITLMYDENEPPEALPDEAKGKFEFGGLIISNKDGQANYPFAPEQHVAAHPMEVPTFKVGDRVRLPVGGATGEVIKILQRNNGYKVRLDDEWLADKPSFYEKEVQVTPLNMEHISALTARHAAVNADEMVQAVRNNLTDDLRKPHYQGNANPMAGHCYVASEALYHLLGGKAAGYKAYTINHEGEPHWFLKDSQGNVLDPTADQFTTPVPYDQARGIGFLTGDKPSKRAQTLLSRIPKTAASDFVTLYHGTDKAFADSIRQTGIRPSDPRRSAWNLQTGKDDPIVYLTKKADEARGYGFGDEDAVVEVRVPKANVEKYPTSSGIWMHHGAIPPEQIVSIGANGGTEILEQPGTGEFSENPEQENPKASENDGPKTASYEDSHALSRQYITTGYPTESDYYKLVDHYVEMHGRMPSDKDLAKMKKKIRDDDWYLGGGPTASLEMQAAKCQNLIEVPQGVTRCPHEATYETPTGRLVCADHFAYGDKQIKATLTDQPEPALPSTDGDLLDDDAAQDGEIRDDVWQADGVKMADLQGAADGEPAGEMMDYAEEDNEVAGDMTQADGVGQFYHSASTGLDIPFPKWLMTGSQSGSGSGASDQFDIAKAAKEHLAVKTFSLAEQRELIDEGQDVKAANLQALDLTGTHYEALEAALAQADDSGEDVFWWG